MVYQSPVRYPVRSTSPVRIGGSSIDAPFRIINFGPSNIYVSDNSGIRPGAGTPIYSGTSLQWLKPTQLFAIADTNADVLVTTEIDDWTGDPVALATATAAAILNSGIVLIDQPQLLSNVQIRSSNNFSTGLIDVSHYQSIILQLDATTSFNTAVSNLCNINFYYSSNPAAVFRSIPLRFTDVGYPEGIWRGSLPIIGAFVEVASPTNTNVNCGIWGSNRPQERIDQEILNAYYVVGPNPANTNTDLFFESQVSYASGTFVRCTIPPWYGELEISGRLVVTAATPATGEPQIHLTRWNPATLAFNAFRSLQGTTVGIPSPGSRSLIYEDVVSMSGDPLRIQVFNSYATPLTNTTLRVTPKTGTLGL